MIEFIIGILIVLVIINITLTIVAVYYGYKNHLYLWYLLCHLLTGGIEIIDNKIMIKRLEYEV